MGFKLPEAFLSSVFLSRNQLAARKAAEEHGGGSRWLWYEEEREKGELSKGLNKDLFGDE